MFAFMRAILGFMRLTYQLLFTSIMLATLLVKVSKNMRTARA